MGRHGPTWTDVGRHWPTWADMGRHGSTSADISRHRPTSADISRHRPKSADIGRHRPTWAHMDRHRPTWADTGRHGPSSADINRHRPTSAVPVEHDTSAPTSAEVLILGRLIQLANIGTNIGRCESSPARPDILQHRYRHRCRHSDRHWPTLTDQPPPVAKVSQHRYWCLQGFSTATVALVSRFPTPLP